MCSEQLELNKLTDDDDKMFKQTYHHRFCIKRRRRHFKFIIKISSRTEVCQNRSQLMI